MPAPTVVQSGIDFLLKYGGTAIGGRRGATLTQALAAIDTTNADSALWKSGLGATTSWDISSDGLYLESSAAKSGYGATLAVDDGALGTNDLAGVRTMTARLSMETFETTNQGSSKARTLLPSTRTLQLDIEGDYIDPKGTAGTALEDLLVAHETGAAIECTLDFGSGGQLVADFLVTNYQLSAPHNDRATFSLTLEAVEEPTDTFTNADTALASLLTAFFATTPSTVAGIVETATSGAHKVSGSVYVTSVEIQIPFNEAITYTYALAGTGALTRGTTT